MNGLKPVSPFSKACSQIAWSPVCDNQQCLCKRNSLLNETTPNIFLCVQTWHQKFQEGRNHKRSGKCGKCIFHFKFLITSLFLVEHEICIADKKYPEGKCDKRSCYNIQNIILLYYSNIIGIMLVVDKSSCLPLHQIHILSLCPFFVRKG